MDEPSEAQKRILRRLKQVEGMKASDLANEFGVTSSAIRQQLDDLLTAGLVRTSSPTSSGGRGRPSVRWSLTSKAGALFPDRHGDLIVWLLESVRETIGDDQLDKIIRSRSAHVLDTYRAELGDAPVELGVKKLAAIRDAEGYMAEVTTQDDGSWLLTEHHCPICVAASICQGICRDELELFQTLFANKAEVKRTRHLLTRDTRCVYQISPTDPNAAKVE